MNIRYHIWNTFINITCTVMMNTTLSGRIEYRITESALLYISFVVGLRSGYLRHRSHRVPSVLQKATYPSLHSRQTSQTSVRRLRALLLRVLRALLRGRRGTMPVVLSGTGRLWNVVLRARRKSRADADADARRRRRERGVSRRPGGVSRVQSRNSL